VNTRVRHQVGLEFSDVDVQSAIKAQGRGQGADDLSDQTVQVGVGRALDVQITAADVVQSLVINLVGHVSVLKK